MNRFFPLLQREWLQYRFGWALMVLIPLALAVLALSFGQVQLDAEDPLPEGRPLAAMLTFAAIAGTMIVLGGIAWVQSVILVTGLARRDHGDRSIEFWLSLPTSHSTSLGAPLLMHLVLVPAAALLAGLVIGLALSMLLVGRVAGLSAWISLPWGEMLGAATALTLRLVAGLPLMTLWLSPLILLAALMVAWFRRWGLVILAVLLALGSSDVGRIFGQPLLAQTLSELLQQAGMALIGAGRRGMTVRNEQELLALLGSMPGWVLSDFLVALRHLASPLFVGALAVAAACFAGLVDWRRRGAAAASH